MKIWAKITNSQQWENPNIRYRNILRVTLSNDEKNVEKNVQLIRGSFGKEICTTYEIGTLGIQRILFHSARFPKIPFCSKQNISEQEIPNNTVFK